MGVKLGAKRGPYNVANTRVSKTLDKTLALEVQKVALEAFMKADMSEQVNELRKKASAVARSRYQGTLIGVSRLLNNPNAPHFRTGGMHATSVNVQYPDSPPGVPKSDTVQVTSGRSSAQPWRRLSENYIEAHPRSVTFWRKTGVLASLYNGWLSYAMPTISALNRYSNARIKETKLERRGKPARKFSFQLYFPRLHPAIDVLIREAFISGKAKKVAPTIQKGYDADATLYRIQPPEAHRPWISRFAAVMGRIFYVNLKGL